MESIENTQHFAIAEEAQGADMSAYPYQVPAYFTQPVSYHPYQHGYNHDERGGLWPILPFLFLTPFLYGIGNRPKYIPYPQPYPAPYAYPAPYPYPPGQYPYPGQYPQQYYGANREE